MRQNGPISSDQKSATPSYRAKLIVAAIAVIIAGVLGEVLARGIAEPPLVRFVQMEDRLAGSERGQFIELVEGDANTFWRLRPNVTLPEDSRPFFGLVSNRKGLREEATHGAKTDGEVRILFMGDSCIFGYGLSHEQTISHFVEKRLNAKFPKASIECINAGVPGYTLFQGYKQLEALGFDLKPDLVVLSFGWNDGDSWDGRSDAAQFEARHAEQPWGPFAWSRLATMTLRAMTTSSSLARPWPSQPRVSAEEYAALLEKIKSDLHERGIDLLLLVPGSKGTIEEYARHGDEADLTAYQVEGIRVGRKMTFGPYQAAGHVDAIAILSRLLKKHSVDELFLDSVHPSAIANEAVAQSVAHRLVPWLREQLP